MMKDERMTDERLRELYARAMHTRVGCVTPDDMLLLVQGQGDERRRLELLDHVMTCAECRREFDLVRTVEVAGRGYVESDVPLRGTVADASSSHTRWRWRNYSTLLVAAAVLVAVGTGVEALRGRGVVRNSESEVMRGATGTSGANSIVAIGPAANADVTAPVKLSWHSVPGAARYHVEVLDASGAAVADGSGADTVFAVPTRPLVSGADYSWWVRAETDSGELSSPLRRFRITSAK